MPLATVHQSVPSLAKLKAGFCFDPFCDDGKKHPQLLAFTFTSRYLSMYDDDKNQRATPSNLAEERGDLGSPSKWKVDIQSAEGMNGVGES